MFGFNPYLGILQAAGAAERRRALEVLSRLEIRSFAERRFEQLSEGQKQLVILARALVQNTPVMMMDEPDSALDFLNRHLVLGKIRQLIHDEQKAGLITLHDANFALTYCDRLIMLKNGAIADELYPEQATAAQVRHCLGQIYGAIAVQEYENKNGEKRFLIVKA
jgi:iron complex transport system ATP-binding protein